MWAFDNNYIGLWQVMYAVGSSLHLRRTRAHSLHLKFL